MSFDEEVLEAVQENPQRFPGVPEAVVARLTPTEKFKIWLEWNGIVGYHEVILQAVTHFGVLRQKEVEWPR